MQWRGQQQFFDEQIASDKVTACAEAEAASQIGEGRRPNILSETITCDPNGELPLTKRRLKLAGASGASRKRGLCLCSVMY
jgi:hypothetical protein